MNDSNVNMFYNKPIFWIWFIIVLNCTYKFCINYFHLPSEINYLNDLAVVILLYCVIKKYQKRQWSLTARDPFLLVLLLFCITVISYVLHPYRPLVYVWGLRTLFRFMIFFIACTCFCNVQMVYKVLRFLTILVLLCVPLCTFQYLSGYHLDSVTGFFSEGKRIIGGNGGQNMLFCIVCSFSILTYLNKKISLVRMLLPVLSCVYLSAIGELKVFYFELVLIVVLCMFYSRVNVKTIATTCVLGVVVLAGMHVYNVFYGDRYLYTSRGISPFSLEGVLMYIGADGQSYGSMYSLNRISAFSYVWNNFLTQLDTKLFGLGAGVGDNVTFDLFASPFYHQNSRLGYHLWSASLELTNVGLLGLLSIIALMAAPLFKSIEIEKKRTDHQALLRLAKVITIISLFLLFYNSGIIVDLIAPNMYFILAIPFVVDRETSQRTLESSERLSAFVP